MVLLIPLLFLASAPDAGATPPATSEPTAGRVAIIWGGGKDAAAANEWRERWEVERKKLGPGTLALAPGYPKGVSSATVPGLKPGFEVVLLGFCRPDESPGVRRYIKALHPFIYERPVTAETSSACPGWADPSATYTVAEPQTATASGVTLTVVAVSVKGGEGTSGDAFTTGWVDVVARDGKSGLLDAYSVEDSQSYGGSASTTGCETSVEAVRKGAVVLERVCTWPPGAACNRNPGERKRTTVRWDGKALVAEDRTLEKWTVDYDKDCAE